MPRIRPIVKTHGGKWYLHQWLLDHFPPGLQDMTYVEPFCGGGSCCLNKPPSITEVISDIDTNLMSVWWALKFHPEEFLAEVSGWPYNRESFARAVKQKAEAEVSDDCTMPKAVCEFVLRRMSRGGLGRAFAWSERLRGGKPGDLNAWETMLGMVPRVAERVRGVRLHACTWQEVFAEYDSPSTFFYLDPPYVRGTRSKSATQVYAAEMSDKNHRELLDACLGGRGKFMISGYQSSLYAQKLRDWRFHFRPIPNHSSQTDRKQIKLECIWTSY